MSITASSMLVEMNISVWTANKIDKGQTEKVIEQAHAAAKSATVRKNLMAGTHLRKEIADYSVGCNTWHRSRTLPWQDRGARLLPTSMFFEYKTEVNTRKDKFERMVAEFLTNYPALVQTAGNHLVDMFNPHDYPSVDEVASKFGFRMVYSPVPEAGDFRIDLPQRELNEMRESYDTAFNTRLADAMKEPWERLHETLSNMSKKLTEAEGEEKKRYYDSLLGNAHELVGMLTHLNLTGDPKLEQARKDLERSIFGVDMNDIKESVAVRADVKGKLDAILKQYEW